MREKYAFRGRAHGSLLARTMGARRAPRVPHSSIRRTPVIASIRRLFACQRYSTRDVFDGDYGMPAQQGFYHKSMGILSVPTATTDRLLLPRGTSCGFKHTFNSPEETCFGRDPYFECPAGWLRKGAGDTRSPGHYWFWCEYQDPNDLCPPGKCRLPQGAACGITYQGIPLNTYGACEGYPVGTCPPGYVKRGPRDEGAPAGYGITWCEATW
jgi:hypothetical protein